tara:strand:+ start:675 stop:962 length:288 start_codon:yes stop_codon:yes gene_type:complete
MAKIRKNEIPGLLAEIDNWRGLQLQALAEIEPMFRRWFEREIRKIKSGIENQELQDWQMKSRCRRLASVWGRMQSGEIESVSNCGTSFTIKTERN